MAEGFLHDLQTGAVAATFDARAAAVITGGQDGSLFVCQVPGTSHLSPLPEAPVVHYAPLPPEEGAARDSSKEAHVIEEVKAAAAAAAASLSQPAKEATRRKLHGLRERFQECLQQNAVAPDLERLKPEELLVDVRLRDLMTKEGGDRVAEIRSRVTRENEVQEVVRARLKALCWDAMEVHGNAIRALQTGLLVHNFPVPKEDRVDALGAKAALLRQVEMQEEAYFGRENGDERMRNFHAPDTAAAAAASAAAAAAASAAAAAPTGAAAQFGRSTTLQSAASSEVEHDLFNEYGEGPKQGAEVLMYSAFDLTPPSRRVTQIYLLRKRVREVKREFNIQFDEMVKRKHAEVDRILDTNQRILEIQKDLDRLNKLPGPDSAAAAAANATGGADLVAAGSLPAAAAAAVPAPAEPLFVPTVHDHEMPEKCLTVEDSEVPAERYISPEERARREAERAAEEARMAALKKDDVFDRALRMMMNGTLESRSAEEEELSLIRPDWMNGDPAKFSEEQVKQFRAFQAREKEVEEEKEKKREALEREVKGLRATIDEGCKRFDEALAELQRQRLFAKSRVHDLELRMVRLAAGLDRLREYSDIGEAELQHRVEELAHRRQQAERAVHDFKTQVDVKQLVLDQLASEDKSLDKAFKREFAETGDYLPQLQQLYRKRVPCRRDQLPGQRGRPSAAGGAGLRRPFEGLHRGALEPFAAAGREEPEFDYFEPLDMLDLPEGLQQAWWDRLIEVREAKIESELRIRAEQAALQEMQGHLERLHQEEREAAEQLREQHGRLERYRAERDALLYDLEIPLTLKQGQVEVLEPVPGDDSLLLHRSVVESVNAVIKDHGDKKVEILTAIKDFKKGIYSLQWETQKLDLEARDWVEKTKEFQLLRVTKDLQQVGGSGVFVGEGGWACRGISAPALSGLLTLAPPLPPATGAARGCCGQCRVARGCQPGEEPRAPAAAARQERGGQGGGAAAPGPARGGEAQAEHRAQGAGRCAG